ncbi:MAG: ATP-binding protein [Sedimentisphaerales bacterium]|jgi:PAS domain S-box-containing protein
MKKTLLFKSVSEILSICIFLGGSTVLIGWILDIPVLKSISPDFVTMKANTAVCFVFIGLSLWLSQTKRHGNGTVRRIARLCAFIVFLTGFLTFWEYMLGRDLGIDQLLFKKSAAAILTSYPGRMAFNSSIIFVMIGIALLLCGFEAALFPWLAQLLVIPAGIVALLAFVGYLYGVNPLHIGPKFSTAMALHTSVLFMMSCIGCIFVRPEQGLMKDISGDNFGSIMIRRILPIIIVIPLVLGWFKIHGEKTGLFSNEFGVSFVAVSNLFIISLSVYILSAYMNRLDAKRRQSEEELKSSLSLLSASLESTADGILIVDRKGSIARWNQKFVDMWKIPEEVISSHDDEKAINYVLAQLAAPEQFVAKVKKLYEQPEESSIDQIEFLDGRVFDRYSQPQKIGDDIVGRVWSFRDITERKKAERHQTEILEQLEQTNRHLQQEVAQRTRAEKSLEILNANLESTVTQLSRTNKQLADFAHLTAHDLKTPLRGIGTLAQWLYTDYYDKFDDNGRRQINLLVKRVKRMDNIINAILQYSTITKNKTKECKVDLNVLTKEVINRIRPPENIKITINKTLPILICEEEHLWQVFLNLISNAVKFSDKPQTSIIIDVEDEKYFWKFSVADNGPGLEPQYFDKIFQLFQMLNNHDDVESEGVGLTLTKKIVELYDGKIWLTSKVGVGSTFFFTLPKQMTAVSKSPQPA